MSEYIVKNNKIIAKFMGHEEGYDEHGVWQKFKYHSSYDSLMPVVQKICEEITDLGIYSSKCHWNPEHGYVNDVYKMKLNTPINKIWNSVIKYIIKKNKTKI